MGHTKRPKGKNIESVPARKPPFQSRPSEPPAKKRMLEVVLKCDSVGSEEAVIGDLASFPESQVGVKVIHTGIGNVTKSDLLLALTGSRLVVGFNVGTAPKIQLLSREKGVEIRLYNVIYRMADDIKDICARMMPSEEEEKITGRAGVIETFKSSRKGIILGCEVNEGMLSLGKTFRIISAMGPIYTGRIESLQIEKNAVKEARAGQQVGLKITDFKKVKIGDFIECFEIFRPNRGDIWQPRGGVFKYF